MKIPLIKGRYLDEHDTENSPWVIVVNQAFAHKYFPNEDPIGQQILLRYDPYPVDQPRPRQIVGVVGDVKHRGLGKRNVAICLRFLSAATRRLSWRSNARAFARESSFANVARPSGRPGREHKAGHC